MKIFDSPTIVCGTGHRPDKLGGYGSATRTKLVALATAWLTANKPDLVISGMALGWDQALAVAAIRLGIPVHAYVPFWGQESQWPEEARQRYLNIVHRCAELIVVSAGDFSPAKMQRRNEAMVDASSLVLALWDGSPGGTANCIRYAEKVGKSVVNLWEGYQP